MDHTRRIAKIRCRMLNKDHNGGMPPVGFQVCTANEGKKRLCDVPVEDHLTLFLHEGQIVSVGRDNTCHVSIQHPHVSRSHLVIYSITYGPGYQPLIYVRDSSSLEGTFVNDRSIGSRIKCVEHAYLLSEGDTISIRPYWEFHITSLYQTTSSSLSGLQLRETSIFRQQYSVTDRVLGEGSYGSVRLAFEKETGRQLACKIHDLNVIRRSYPSDWQYLHLRIKGETDLLAKLEHPNLLKYEFAFESSNTLYTFTELATGGDLFSKLSAQKDQRFCESMVIFIVRQLISAVCFLHSKGIVHRDIKLENIFFAYGPDHTSRLVLGDFGFAKNIRSGRLASKVGTEGYMAPEFICGNPHYTMAVDIWSVGILILYLFGVPPGDLQALRSLSQLHVNERIKSVLQSISESHHISAHCQNFIGSCLVLDPSQRSTAFACWKHPWFQLHREGLDLKIKESQGSWEPRQSVAPMVVPLDLWAKAKDGRDGSEATSKQKSRHFEPVEQPAKRRRTQSKLPQMKNIVPSQERSRIRE
ncbi:kinase-like protein [Xylariaceae sp. FL0016]|nr:kinase-like protein [Xylariaceae sp. FL0016]